MSFFYGLFTQQDIATEEIVNNWPKTEYAFCQLFEALIDIPKQTRGFCGYMGGIDEKFAQQLDGYWEQQKCLHCLISEVGEYVRRSLSLDRSHFKLRYYRELRLLNRIFFTDFFERYDELRLPLRYFVSCWKYKKLPSHLGRTSLQLKLLN